MKWTQKHSRNAVAKRARLRVERATREPMEDNRRVQIPRVVPDFTINIRSRSGDRLQITATRFGKSIISEGGFTSARKIARGIEMLIRHAAP